MQPVDEGDGNLRADTCMTVRKKFWIFVDPIPIFTVTITQLVRVRTSYKYSHLAVDAEGGKVPGEGDVLLALAVHQAVRGVLGDAFLDLHLEVVLLVG